MHAVQEPTDADKEAEFLSGIEATEAPQTQQVAPQAAAPIVPTPVADEPFPGFNGLPAEAQARWKEREEAAEKASAQVKEWQEKFTRQQGQLVPAQRQIAELRLSQQDLQKKLEEFQKSGTQGSRNKLNEAINKHNDMFPGEGDAIKAIADSMDEATAGLHSKVTELQTKLEQQEAVAYKREQTDILTSQHPDWKEVLADSSWEAWFNALDPELQRLARSPQASHVSLVFDNYKRDKQLAEALFQKEQGLTPQAPPVRAKPEVDPKPTTRRPIAANATTGNTLDGEDKFAADLASAGYNV